MKKLNTDEKGSILPMFGVVLVLFFMMAAVAIDYSRYTMASEKLFTATESAATSAALTAKRYVRLEIDPGRRRVCCPSADGGCTPCCEPCNNKRIVTGREDELIEKKGWRKYCCSCGCGGYELLDRWVVYEKSGSDSKSVAKMFFDMNKPKEMTAESGGRAKITSVTTINNRRDPNYPSVIVESQGSVKTLLMGFLDNFFPGTSFDNLEAERCSQGGTFYYNLRGNWIRGAREGCE